MQNKEDKQLKVFSYGVPLICYIWAWHQYAQHGTALAVEGLIITGSTILLIAVFFPPGLKPVFKYWMKAAQAVSGAMTVLILTLIFLVVITPISIVLRLMGKDHMNLGIQKNARSYWIKREKRASSYTQQF